jgi:hypothetical protein
MSIFRPEGKGRRWGLLRKFEVPDLDEPLETYLTRYVIVRTPLFAIYVHRMDRPDSRAVLHDHPWDFISFVLRGGYWEMTDTDTRDQPGWKVKYRLVRRVNVKRATASHYIRHLVRVPTWTLLLTGPRRRTWGYWDRLNPQRRTDFIWVPFDQHPTIASEFDRAMSIRNAHKEK